MEQLHHAKRVPFQVPFLRGENPKELNRRRLCLRLFARASRFICDALPRLPKGNGNSQRSSASSSHAFAHDAFRLSPKRVLPRRLLLFPKNLCVCKSFSGALLSRRKTADTYRPPSSSFLPFQVPFLRGGDPKELNRRRLCLRLFARASRFICDALPRLPQGNGNSQRRPAEGTPPGFRQILTVPLLRLFYLFRYPFCVVRTQKN